MQQPSQAETPFPNQQKVDYAAKALFTLLLENELSEAETVAAIAQALTMRLAYASKDILELEQKLQKFPEIFLAYARINLSTAQSAILQKQAFIKGMN